MAGFPVRAGRAFTGAALLIALVTTTVLAAGPTREVFDLNDPQIDVDESAFWSAECGFPVQADISGQIAFLIFPDGDGRSVVELDVFGIRAAFTNPATGKTLRNTDVGPDRIYVQDGILYVAITGRSFNLGVVIFDITNGFVLVHQAGRDNGFFEGLCDNLAG